MNDYKKGKTAYLFFPLLFFAVRSGIRDAGWKKPGEHSRYLLQLLNLLEAEDINLMRIVWLRLVQAGHEVELLRVNGWWI